MSTTNLRYIAIRKPDRRIRSVACGLILLMVWSGCASTPKPIFDPVDPPLLWPDNPLDARIRYLGEIDEAADLKPVKSFWQGLSSLFVGPPPPSPLFGPRDVVCTPDGEHVWIADTGGRCLHGFDLQHRTYTKITQLDSQMLLSPVSVALGPDQSIFVCDSEVEAVYRISSITGEWQKTLNLPDSIYRPVAVAYDHRQDEIYIVDITAHDIKVLTSEGAFKRILGRRGEKTGEFNYPSDVIVHHDTIWVVDSGNHRIQSLERNGNPLSVIGKVGDAPGDLAMPKGVALDSEGHIYVVDARFENIQVFDAQKELLLFWGQEGSNPGEFWLPSGIFIDALDRIWVCDSYNRRVQVFQYIREQPLTRRPKNIYRARSDVS